MPSPVSPVHRYHDGTKHHFTHFARSTGFLDWATRPRPFRSFGETLRFPLFPAPAASHGARPAPAIAYDNLFTPRVSSEPLTASAVGDLLRHSLGLSAWKAVAGARWSLRVNPSSGNLHPTEVYVVVGGLQGLADYPAVYHYAPDQHALEMRCRLDVNEWTEAGASDVLLIGLTSIHWRESWKYGERAFRYCQHDIGHAVAAVAMGAAMLGWSSRMLSSWSHGQIATLTGVDRDEDFFEAEREDPACLLAISLDPVDGPPAVAVGAPSLLRAIARGQWTGRASQLSVDHVEWTFIDEIARATQDPGRPHTVYAFRPAAPPPPRPQTDARWLVLQRRSAVSFDGRSILTAASFFAMLSRLAPASCAPWATQWWPPRLHLLLFVHRVEGLAPGLYLLGRDRQGAARLRAAMGRGVLDEPVENAGSLVCLAKGDCRAMSRRLCCDQAIASDGFFSLGMIAEFDSSLAEHGDAFYRHLFWESGMIGQVLYLEAQAAGVAGTGIGCFYDDAVHEVLGLEGHAFQSLYHFTVGAPVDDGRLTSEPGYPWDG